MLGTIRQFAASRAETREVEGAKRLVAQELLAQAEGAEQISFVDAGGNSVVLSKEVIDHASGETLDRIIVLLRARF